MNRTIQARIDDSMVRDIEDTIKEKLDTEVDQTDKSTVGAFFLGLGVTTNDDRTNLKKNFEVAIKTKVTRVNIQTIIENTVNINDGEIENDGKITGDIKIDQNIACNIVITNLIQQIFEETNKLLVDNETDLKVTQATETKINGLEWVILICVFICLFLICSSFSAILAISASSSSTSG
jgi:hypothetical protein